MSQDIIKKRSPEWIEHQLRWRFLFDSLEGGERYRQAIYGYDARRQPVRNLIRHKREYPDPTQSASFIPVGADQSYAATDDDYELRRARTPVPTFVKEAVTDHLDRVFAKEVARKGPDALTAWWADVDGRGTCIDTFMHETLGPILLTTGQVDVLCDSPPVPESEVINTQADVQRLGLDRCLISVILPENALWWELDPQGRYIEVLIRENENYRLWDSAGSILFDAKGKEIARKPHPFGRVPIVRLFSRRKPRCEHVGQSDYEGVAERQREYYNRDSELILSDTLQVHPLLQCPEDYIVADGTIPVGPGWILPKKKNTTGTTTTYEGFDAVEFPKGGADSLRTNKHDLRDEVDRDAALNKPAGTTGTVAQSGVSKSFDNNRLNNKLCSVAKILASAEKDIARLVLKILGVEGEFEISYSQQFDLYTDLGVTIKEILEIAGIPAAKQLKTITAEFLKTIIRQSLPGRSDSVYNIFDKEIDQSLTFPAK